MRLLSGPAGSGKTTYVLDRFREALHAGNRAVRLLVPTATMAQHLQNRLARDGFVFRPNLIQTLSGFLRAFPGVTPEVPPSVLYLLVEQAAHRVARPEFARVTQFPGFCASLARTIDEFASAGCDSARLAACLPEAIKSKEGAPLGDAFLAVYQEVDRELERRGLALRGRRLARAAELICTSGLHPTAGPGDIKTIWLDGFRTLPDPELSVIAALGRHTDLTLTLDDADLTAAAVARLGAMDFSEQRAHGVRTHPAVALVKAPAIEREVEEIARRILEQAAAGRPFREIGIIVRTPQIYAPILRATLERFGIPARFYVDAPLERHPVVRFLSGALDAMLGGWQHADTLAVLRLAPRFADSGVMDRFDFDVREQTPNGGLRELRALLMDKDGQPRPTAQRLLDTLDSLAALEEWRGFKRAPGDWAARFRTLRTLFRPARPLEPATHELALQYRSQAAALNLFDQALDDAAQALGDAGAMPVEDYWRAVKSILRLNPLRLHDGPVTGGQLTDGRRNVVHVMTAHEARQWVLPIVFVCGMVEKQFPHFHQQDPFFNDAARSRLNHAGIRVRTAAEFEREERMLFDAAITRATMLVTLSYPEFDARGERNLPSIYLEDLVLPPLDSQAVRPAARAPIPERGPVEIRDAALLDYLRQKTARLSPTALETFLQCPFQYFTQRLLYLKTAPDRPEQRLDFITPGNIVHEVLAEWWNQPQDVAALFERVFAKHLREKHIPSGYHAERLRNAMLDDLGRFTTQDVWPRIAFASQTEIKFCFPLGDTADKNRSLTVAAPQRNESTEPRTSVSDVLDFGGRVDDAVEISGRIDRLDIGPDGRAFVIDYKYSAVQRVKAKLKNESLLQAPLYLMAAEHLKTNPAGMFYVGVKGGIEYVGWSDAPLMDSLPLPESWLENTRRRTLDIVGQIRAGRVEVRPADTDSCRFCDSKDVCRVEVQSTEVGQPSEAVQATQAALVELAGGA